jgi:uncharacterized protein YegL
MAVNIPQRYICPITFDLMTNPVIDLDGNTFEQSAIEEWLREHGTSPITRRPMTINDLRPNRAIKEGLEEYQRRSSHNLLQPQIITEELPAGEDFQVLFDTSPSMEDPCSKNKPTTTDSMNYSKLDIAKHALKTFVHSLIENDKVHRLSLVEFNSKASLVFDFVKVTKTNIPLLISKIDSLQTRGSTDIWDAFRVGIELIERNKITSDVKVLLLTDGETVNPERVLPNIQSFLRMKSTIRISIATFGFGNDINSKLLYDISKEKNGIFGFMPDGTMLGTVFVNSISKLMTNEKKLMTNEDEVVIQNLIKTIRSFLHNCQSSFQSSMIELVQCIPKSLNTPFMNDLRIDCTNSLNANDGQIYKSMLPEYYREWGQHYLLSVLSAFENKFCLNFKDKAIQHFKTDSFISYQDKINDIYISLPPPQPTQRVYDYGTGRVTQTYSAPVSSQQFSQRFNNANDNGCFVEGSKIYIPDSYLLKDMELMNVEDVKKGMYVHTMNGIAKVLCTIKMKFRGTVSMHKDGTQLTSYHPVFLNGRWSFPKENIYFTQKDISDTYVYNFILENDHTIRFPNFYAATFNHGITGDVIGHEYFGTNLVQDDLMKHPGWSDGFIQLENFKYLRDENNLVCGLEF